MSCADVFRTREARPAAGSHLYQRLYHLPMPGEDNLSNRFDYLLEPLDDEESTDGGIDAESATDEAPGHIANSRSAAPFPSQGPQGGGRPNDLVSGVGLPGPL